MTSRSLAAVSLTALQRSANRSPRAAKAALARMLGWTDAATLRALAKMFERQAKECHLLADEAETREAAAEASRRRRADAGRQLLRMGARLHVLARIHGSFKAAKAAVRSRDRSWSLEKLDLAATTWRRERAAKTVRRRNIAIWKARLAKEPEAALAARYGISTRMVRKICAQVERELLRGAAR